ncbi:AraC family transcriptional regulator [Roseobacter weihaiensis]|uniref:AraC family transcriptional regulator n=1 Tax=Roseobacter weihaiensis TaxID=2763262 RepID=UPI001D0BDCF7|nr:AraC family transcriptional regulator [Roseobacter sp. H9]
MGCWVVHPGSQRDALYRWQEGLARAFVRLDAEAVGVSGVFGGCVDQVRAGDLQVSRVAADAHRVIRRKEHAARARQDMVFANLQVAGRGAVSIGRGQWSVSPMDLCLVPTSDPYQIHHTAPFELISIAIPSRVLPKDLSLGPIALSNSAVGREIAAVLVGLARLARALPENGDSLMMQILSTLQLAASVEEEQMPNDPSVLRAAVEAHIARRHNDPNLSASPLAAAFGVSERRLHALFHGTGQSVGMRIEAARMVTARRLLETGGLPISQVAARAGFRDTAYFTRVFKRAHGQSPREWRGARLSKTSAQ